MREQFEKLPEIAKILNRNGGGYYKERTNDYHHCNLYFDKFLNGAWYAFQEQQEKIARLQSALDDLKEWAQDEKQKSLDSNLSEYNNAKYVMAALLVENINRITGADK